MQNRVQLEHRAGTEKLAVNYVAFRTLKVQPLPLSYSQHIS